MLVEEVEDLRLDEELELAEELHSVIQGQVGTRDVVGLERAAASEEVRDRGWRRQVTGVGHVRPGVDQAVDRGAYSGIVVLEQADIEAAYWRRQMVNRPAPGSLAMW